MEFINIDLKKLKEEYESGKSLRELAIKYETSKLTIKRKLEKIGVTILSSADSISRMSHKKVSSLRYKLDKNVINELYDSGLSSRQLATKFNCSEYAVLKLINNKRKISKEYINNRFDIIYNSVKPSWCNEENLYQLYIVNKMSINEIAKLYNYDDESIREMLIKFGIDRRTIIESTELKFKKIGYTSNLEKIIKSILDDYNIDYYKGYFGGYEFDFVINDSLLIEINGLYYHNLNKKVDKDKEKFEYWENNLKSGYGFITIWENEFSSYESVYFRLSQFIDLNKKVNIDFKCIEIRQIHKNDAEMFLNKYHYLSKMRGGKYIGAYYNNILISVCIFSNVTRNESLNRLKFNKYEMKELSRFCIHPKYQVKNLASFLLSKYINTYKILNHDVKCLISFAEKNIHVGTIYKASNWIEDGCTNKSYYYEKDGMKWHKKTIWDYSKQLKISEKEFSLRFGLNKIDTDVKFRFLYYFK